MHKANKCIYAQRLLSTKKNGCGLPSEYQLSVGVWTVLPTRTFFSTVRPENVSYSPLGHATFEYGTGIVLDSFQKASLLPLFFSTSSSFYFLEYSPMSHGLSGLVQISKRKKDVPTPPSLHPLLPLPSPDFVNC